MAFLSKIAQNIWQLSISNSSVIKNDLAPNTSIGDSTDVEGIVAFDSTYFYYCTSDYTGSDNIWKRIAWSNDTW
jgi:hypothetical protein